MDTSLVERLAEAQRAARIASDYASDPRLSSSQRKKWRRRARNARQKLHRLQQQIDRLSELEEAA